MTLIAIVDDLLFQAKIREAAGSLGAEVRFVKAAVQVEEAWLDPAVIVVDLQLTAAEPLEIIRAVRSKHPTAAMIGYGAHVQAELLAQARAAGCTTVLPRSAFIQQLGRLLSSQPLF